MATERNSKYALVANPGSPFKVIPCADVPSLGWLQGKVGGYIEIVNVHGRIGSNLKMVIDEEGKYKDYTANLFATAATPLFADFIFGTAVILRMDGEDLIGFDYNEAKSILQRLNHA